MWTASASRYFQSLAVAAQTMFAQSTGAREPHDAAELVPDAQNCPLQRSNSFFHIGKTRQQMLAHFGQPVTGRVAMDQPETNLMLELGKPPIHPVPGRARSGIRRPR
jgi:hypothetical protein